MIVDLGDFFLYRHIRLDTNEVFYVGIGTKEKNKKLFESEYKRAFTKGDRNTYWHNIVKLCGYKVEILLESNNYDFLETKEKEFIKIYGRKDKGLGSLVNLTDGGKGSSKGTKKKRNPNLVPWNLGKKMSLEHRQKLSVAQTNPSLERREQMSKTHKGKKISKEEIERRIKTMFENGSNGNKVIDTNTGIIYRSVMKCANALEISNTTLHRNLNNLTKVNKYPNLKYFNN